MPFSIGGEEGVPVKPDENRVTKLITQPVKKGKTKRQVELSG